MKHRDMALAALTSVIWGFAFVAVQFGLESFSPSQLTVARFLVACLPVVLVPRPNVSWWLLGLIGLTLFAGQFLLLFFAYAQGMPRGLASVTQQMQVFFTVLLAAAFLRDVPSPRQWIGMAIAFAGLALIGVTAGSDVTLLGLGLALGGALSWAVGNVLVKRTPNVPMFPLVVWCSLIPPVPAVILSRVYDRHGPFLAAATERVTAEPWGGRLSGRNRHKFSPTPRGVLCCSATRPRSSPRSLSLLRAPESLRPL